MTRHSSILLCALVSACFAVVINSSHAQQQGHSIGLQPPYEQNTQPVVTSRAQAEKLTRWANAERQKQMVKNSTKLVELTAQLKQRMAERADKNINDDDLKIVAQIEKLARNIREAMAFADEAPIPPTPQPLLTF